MRTARIPFDGILLAGQSLPEGDPPLGIPRHHPYMRAPAVGAYADVRVEAEAKEEAAQKERVLFCLARPCAEGRVDRAPDVCNGGTRLVLTRMR